jgi:hypothetical protein
LLLDTDSISPTRLVHFRSSLGLGLGQQLAHLLAKVEVGRSSDGGKYFKLVRAMRNPPASYSHYPTTASSGLKHALDYFLLSFAHLGQPGVVLGLVDDVTQPQVTAAGRRRRGRTVLSRHHSHAEAHLYGRTARP